MSTSVPPHVLEPVPFCVRRVRRLPRAFLAARLLAACLLWVPVSHAAAPGAAVTAPEPRGPVTVTVEARQDELAELVAHGRVVGWDRVTRDRGRLVLVVSAEELEDLRRALGPTGRLVRIESASTSGAEGTDHAKKVSRTDAEIQRVSRSGGIPLYPCYRTVEETEAALQALEASAPGLTELTDIGDSWEKQDGASAGYDVRSLRITDESKVPEAGKAPLVILAASHAREYATAETATRFAELLVAGFGTDPEITALLATTEVHVVGIHNPDGRKVAEGQFEEPSWEGSMQRKNLRAGTCSSGAAGDGVDLNRNAAQFFRLDLGDPVPEPSSEGCVETYSGPVASSEPETMAVDALMASVFTEQRGEGDTDSAPDDATGLFLSIHSWGEYVLYPWEAKHEDPPNHDQLRSLGRRFGFRLPGYVVCQDCFGTAAGTNVDEAYGRYGVAAYTWELGTSFRQPCSGSGVTFEDDVWPMASDVLRYALKAARRPYQEPSGPEVVDVTWSSGPHAPGAVVPIAGTADDTRFAFETNGASSFSDTEAEPVEQIAAVYYSIDDPPWTLGTLPTVDAGPFDDVVEPFAGSIDTTGLEGGVHLLYLVAEDTGGQMGVPTVFFLEIDAGIFADGFESGDLSAW